MATQPLNAILRPAMSDFFQHGLISTLHQLNEHPAELELPSGRARLALILPCHYRDLASDGLTSILQALNCSSLFDLVVVTMNGMPDAEKNAVVHFWSQLRTPHRVLWNDSPLVLEWLSGKGLDLTPGKGLNLWMAIGFITRHSEIGAFAIHDCDIKNYSIQLPSSLTLPVVALGYRFCKGFYPRVQGQLYGRVTRLFMIPFVRSLVRVIGHLPLLDFVDSFRYPLAGECALTADVAVQLPIESGWGLEVGLLCEVHRLLEPREVCQVDLAIRYDHKHQSLDPGRPREGLLGMVGDLALSILSHLEREGCHLDADILESVYEGYRQAATDFVRRYHDVAFFNRIPFAQAHETRITERFCERLKEIAAEFADGARAIPLPPWNQVAEFAEIADFPLLA